MVRNPEEPRGEQPRRSEAEGGVREWREQAIRGRSGQEMAQQARAAAQEMAQDIRQRSESMLDEQKSGLSEQMRHIGQALHQAAGSLNEQQNSGAAQFADRLGERIDSVAGYLEGHSISSIAADVRDAARRHPQIVMAGMFIGGLLLARFLKSSATAPESGQEYGDYGREASEFRPEVGDISGEGGGEPVVTEFDIGESTEYPGRSALSHGPATPERPPQSEPRTPPPPASPSEAL